jgi:hypothetical protein
VSLMRTAGGQAGLDPQKDESSMKLNPILVAALLALGCGAEAPSQGLTHEEAIAICMDDPDACGAAYDSITPEPPTAEDLASDANDIGSLKQAIFLDLAYGWDGDQNRCWTGPWGGGICGVPDRKVWTINIPTTANPRGCSADFIAGITTAAFEAKWQATTRAGHGWSISVSTATSSPGAITMSCNSGTGGPVPQVAATQVDATPPPFGGWTCNGPSGRKVCQYSKIDWTRVYHNKFAAGIPGWSGYNQTQRRNIIAQVALHENFHSFGFGHDTCAETPLMGSCADPNFFPLPPTDFEIWLMQRYNPTSGQNPQ